MNIAIVGCGYVADFYMASLAGYPNLILFGAYDQNDTRLAAFAAFHEVRQYGSLEQVLTDPSIQMVLNLTDPRSHFDVNKSCLLAGKHVYSEKPLAMDSVKAAELAELARQRGLGLAAAPCSMLGETCQTVWKVLKDGAIGPVRLVYANFDDGMVHRMNPTRWRSASGAPWPVKDEFEIGCTYEHAAYLLSWLAAFFGPAQRVTAYASCRVRDKGVPVKAMAPDFTVGCIEYGDDVVARVTCSVIAPSDKSLVIVGETGVLYTRYVRDDASPVYLKATPPNRLAAGIGARLKQIGGRVEHLLDLPWSIRGLGAERKVKFARKPSFVASGNNKPVDFMRGPHELAESIREGRRCRLSPELGVHMTELIESLQYPERFERTRVLSSRFAPIEPLPWRS